jgi:hypothetical protein
MALYHTKRNRCRSFAKEYINWLRPRRSVYWADTSPHVPIVSALGSEVTNDTALSSMETSIPEVGYASVFEQLPRTSYTQKHANWPDNLCQH